MVVVKWSDSVEGPRVKLDGHMCDGLYKEDDGYFKFNGIPREINPEIPIKSRKYQ